MKRLTRILPFALLGLCLLMSFAHLRKATDSSVNTEGFDTATYAQLPVQSHGRIKPMETVARNSLYTLYGKQRLKLEDGSKLSAIEWLMAVQMRPSTADTYKCFRIDNDQILGIFGMKQDGKYFSYNDIEPYEQKIFHLARDIQKREAAQHNVMEKQVLKLTNALTRYHALQNFAIPAVLPPTDKTDNHWLSLYDVMQDEQAYQTANPSARLFYRGLFESYPNHNGTSNPEAFNATVGGLRHLLTSYPNTNKIKAEVIFKRAAPFLQSQIFYLCALMLILAAWIASAFHGQTWQSSLQRSALYMIVFSFLIHTIALLTRMYLQGRPPVTNLYSSAIFVGWAAVPIAIITEVFLKNGIGAAVASICGFITLLIAPALTSSADNMEMMQAVLDSNFWLATHVVVISMGYSAMFVAGFMAMFYIILGVLTPALDKSAERILSNVVYGIICFAMLFSFVGTMLGGVWADQSWGRFWGWDPKENGALLIVLWCAIILHARWGALCRTRGVMVMAVAGNIITSWSWFGTNMLGVGLHSYGFSDAKFTGLVVFITSQLLIIGMGAFPKNQWRSAKAIQ